ncbi:hypothetical protein Rsub_03926 [Raphidocelis subcapitata]|uniref:ABC1 atypical kinase-like domain-containing protein n=1 Tax=Raphidocelis subcapitata TaxID=307507 RepID=A0A2V0NZQ1_9CHLO|nr:hypothetical protein Rsub_03926 [Raphidocelis subcapitata]|eukprot:GBF91070.1 hypothetical protein Rsub_03926 [Raphidocelis subcapitata]
MAGQFQLILAVLTVFETRAFGEGLHARTAGATRQAELQELLRETLDVALTTGPRGVLRGLQAAGAVGGLAAEYAAAGRLDPPQVVLRKLFERLGTTYIKLGQFIASTPSIFPEEYCEEMQLCLDRAAPVPWATVEAILRQDLGRPLREVFSSIDERPLASASIAQVHAAVLAGSGKEVVIKVVKPGTADIIAADLNAVYLATRFLEFAQPELSGFSLGPIVAQLRASMAAETDLLQEATHLTHFADFLDRRGLRGVATCPYLYRQFSSKRVMVLERLRGVPLTDLAAVSRAVTSSVPAETVLINALNVWGASVLGAETFHADLHAGNLLALPDGRAGFLDFGIAGRVSEATWRGLEALLGSTAVGDYATMARALGAMGAAGEGVDYDAFARDLGSFFSQLESLQAGLVVATAGGGGGGLAAGLDIDSAAVNRLALELARIGEAHGVRFPPDFGLLLKQSLYFDRYVRALAPDLQVLNDDRVQWRSSNGQAGAFAAAAAAAVAGGTR